MVLVMEQYLNHGSNAGPNVIGKAQQDDEEELLFTGMI